MSKTPSRWPRAVCAGSLATLLGLPPALANNTVIYKWSDRNGNTVYSQTPPARSAHTRVGTLVIPSVPPARRHAAERDLERLKQEADAQQDQLRRQEADDRIEAALRALEAAHAELRAGAAPAPDERVANFGGQPAVRDSYLLRMAELQARADLARQALDDALAARRAL